MCLVFFGVVYKSSVLGYHEDSYIKMKLSGIENLDFSIIHALPKSIIDLGAALVSDGTFKKFFYDPYYPNNKVVK